MERLTSTKILKWEPKGRKYKEDVYDVNTQYFTSSESNSKYSAWTLKKHLGKGPWKAYINTEIEGANGKHGQN